MGGNPKRDLSDEELQEKNARDEARRLYARAQMAHCLDMDTRDVQAVLEIYEALAPPDSGGNRLATAKLLWRMGKQIAALEKRLDAHTHLMPPKS